MQWHAIHMLPNETAQAAEDVRARVLLPAHGGKSHMAGTVPRVAEGERGASLSDGHAAHR